MMQPWIIEELWRQEQDEFERLKQERQREQIQIDSPAEPIPDAGAPTEEQKRGVVIIEL